MGHDWGYEEHNGPSIWPQLYPQAAGTRQSPVNIETTQARSDNSLSGLIWNYLPENCKTISNTGYCWKIDVDGTGSDLYGGPLASKFKLEQFHCHWGRHNNEGSEHTVDGKSYAGELHLVHWDYQKYASFQEAVNQPDGIAVLGILLEVGPEDHPELEKIVQLFPNITFRGQSENIETDIDPAKLLPEDKSYWTYMGSLTTPPCLESVIWILFKTPIQVSEEQLNKFRCLQACDPGSETEQNLLHNYRPPLPLGNRLIRESGSV